MTRSILLLCAEGARHTATVDIHINAFKNYSRHEIVTLDSFCANQMNLDLSMFDAIVLHYSIEISAPQYIPDILKEKIRAFEGIKILFIQDEYRWVDRTSAAAIHLSISVVFSVVNKNVMRKIYRNKYFDKVRFVQTLTGFVPEELLNRNVPSYNERPLDIGYRARKLPGWCGEFAKQKWEIGEKILIESQKHGIKCDIAMSESSRIYGENWNRFLSGCKATLGTESGASFIDFTGLIHTQVEEYEAKNPNATFEMVRDKFLEDRDGEIVIHVISPRIFEAAALRTLLILYPGTYSGILTKGRHYLELQPDHSNIKDIFNILRNSERASEIIQHAYEEIACSNKWTHQTFIAEFDRVFEEEIDRSSFASSELRFSDAQKSKAFRQLEMDNERLSARTKRNMRNVLFLQSIRVKTTEFIEKNLPEFLSRPLIGVGQFATQRIKPVLKRLLLGG